MILKKKVEVLSFDGSHYDIGQKMAKHLDDNIGLCLESEAVSDDVLEEALKLYDEYCPGLTDELKGYADGKGVSLNRLIFVSMTYLRPNCSGMILLPKKTENEHIIVARSYEFAPHLEDFRIYRIFPKGKYSYVGGSIVEFGRSEGINQHGLGVTMTSCGLPVSNVSEMRKPAFKGLQFWAVIRALLENCKTVEESLSMLRDMPIAYNINLLIADASGNAVLYETLDGEKEYKVLSVENSEMGYLHATNHPCLDKMIDIEPFAMKNSVVRYDRIKEFLENQEKINIQNLKEFILKPYPRGLNCSYFKEFFGTIKSVVMDINELTFSICWGGNSENGWDVYTMEEKENYSFLDEKEIEIKGEIAPKEFFDRVSLK